MNTTTAAVDYEAVKQKLAAKGWSNRAAAKHLGVNEGYLSQVLNQRKSSIRLTARVEAMPVNTAKVHPGQPAALRRRIAAHGNKTA
jgi:hypothetical protein